MFTNKSLLLILILIVRSTAFKPHLTNAQTSQAFSSFLELCQRKNSLSPQQKHTINVLLEEASTTNCQKANDYLKTVNSLFLVDRKIKDISPLANLTNLTELLPHDIIDRK